MKIQFLTIENIKYSISTNPEIVEIEKGEFCEFEIFLTPHCTTKINDEIKIISFINKTTSQFQRSVVIDVTTDFSFNIDSDETELNEKIGEGSFGIIYKGIYRNNVVVIKKLKGVP